MRTRTILQLAPFLVLLLATSIEGLFFEYPKNALVEFFQSLHRKKEMKKPMQNIHHYHLHYYPVHTQFIPKPVRAPNRLELDKLFNNQLESLGWSDKEFRRIPEPDIYRPGPLPDAWPETLSTQQWSLMDVSQNSNQSEEDNQPAEIKPSVIVQVPLHQNIILQQPAPEEKPISHPLVSFFKNINNKIKNSLFSHQEEPSNMDYWEGIHSFNNKMSAYIVYSPPENGRKL